MLPFLVGLVQEVLGKVFQSHIIPVKVVGLKRMHMLRSLILTPAGTRSKAHDFRHICYQPYFKAAGIQAKASQQGNMAELFPS